MVAELLIGEMEVHNVQLFVGNSSAGNHFLDSIPGFLAEAEQQPLEESHVRFGKVHPWIAEHIGLNCQPNCKAC
jgi:hypothetical protein